MRWIVCALVPIFLLLGLPQPSAAAGQFLVTSAAPANGAGNVPVNLANSQFNQSIRLQLNLPANKSCALDEPSVNANTSKLISSVDGDGPYALTNAAFGRNATGWWLAVGNAIDGFELLPQKTYTLHLATGATGISVTCDGVIYNLDSFTPIQFTTGSDTVAPTIMGGYASATSTTATVTWETFQAASGSVAFGPGLGSVRQETDFNKTHRVVLDALQPGTTYEYEIRSTDAAGNTGRHKGTFTTVGLGEIAVTDITDMAATVTWTTNQPTDSLIELGTTSAYGNRQGNGLQTTNHSLRLVGLKPDTSYHFRVVATNATGSSRFGDNQFRTKPSPQVAGTASGRDIDGSSENIKLFPDVPLVEPLVLGASNAANIFSDTISVGKNMLRRGGMPTDGGWAWVWWILPIALLILIAAFGVHLRLQQRRANQSG
jgi:hypothetical protein